MVMNKSESDSPMRARGQVLLDGVMIIGDKNEAIKQSNKSMKQ
jgi:hypothetical protein